MEPKKIAGVAEEFLRAIDSNPELLKAVRKITPTPAPIGALPRLPGGSWSCCATA